MVDLSTVTFNVYLDELRAAMKKGVVALSECNGSRESDWSDHVIYDDTSKSDEMRSEFELFDIVSRYDIDVHGKVLAMDLANRLADRMDWKSYGDRPIMLFLRIYRTGKAPEVCIQRTCGEGLEDVMTIDRKGRVHIIG
ncbi:MAG: hypothetical protein HDQ88_11780 [Clostridia bacterium]|nr:hypothetical protein [Clostridia bacterium]